MAPHCVIDQPIDIIVSQRAPVRVTPNESTRSTCSAEKLSQTSQRHAAAPSKSWARQASANALIAPAELPVMTGKRFGALPGPHLRQIRAIAFNTPAW